METKERCKTGNPSGNHSPFLPEGAGIEPRNGLPVGGSSPGSINGSSNGSTTMVVRSVSAKTNRSSLQNQDSNQLPMQKPVNFPPRKRSIPYGKELF